MSDTSNLGDIVRALYETISGPAGQERDWDRMRSLYFPGARLIRTSMSLDGKPRAHVMDVEQYIQDTSDYFRQNSFYEAEVARRVESFGNIAHVFSAYEARHKPDDAEPFKRGINSIQLFNDGSRWWLLNVLWDNEREDNPMPEQLLRG